MRSEQGYDDFRYRTMFELAEEPGIWQLLADTKNFFPNADRAQRAALAEQLIREIVLDGYADLVTRPWNEREVTGRRLSLAEVDVALNESGWRNDLARVPHDANYWLIPTEKWRQWFNDPQSHQSQPEPT